MKKYNLSVIFHLNDWQYLKEEYKQGKKSKEAYELEVANNPTSPAR